MKGAETFMPKDKCTTEVEWQKFGILKRSEPKDHSAKGHAYRGAFTSLSSWSKGMY